MKGGEVAQKLPITTSILLGIKSKLNARHSFDASFWAICLTAFYGLFRKSHLLPLSNRTFDPVSLIKMLGDWKSDSVLLYLTVPLDIRLHTINQLSKCMISTVH